MGGPIEDFFITRIWYQATELFTQIFGFSTNSKSNLKNEVEVKTKYEVQKFQRMAVCWIRWFLCALAQKVIPLVPFSKINHHLH